MGWKCFSSPSSSPDVLMLDVACVLRRGLVGLGREILLFKGNLSGRLEVGSNLGDLVTTSS